MCICVFASLLPVYCPVRGIWCSWCRYCQSPEPCHFGETLWNLWPPSASVFRRCLSISLFNCLSVCLCLSQAVRLHVFRREMWTDRGTLKNEQRLQHSHSFFLALLYSLSLSPCLISDVWCGRSYKTSTALDWKSHASWKLCIKLHIHSRADEPSQTGQIDVWGITSSPLALCTKKCL